MDINEGKRLKELERENSELKKMLAASLLKNRVLAAINAKNGEPGAQATAGRLRGRRRPVFRAGGLPLSAPRAGDVSLSGTAPNGAPVAVGGADPHAVGGAPALRLPPDRGAAAPGRLEREPQAGAARAAAAPEFIAKELQQWLAEQQIKTIYVTPASPWENGFVESFPSRFRHEGLNREQLWTLTEARVVIEDFRQDYNTERPHSSLGYDSPRRFAAKNTLPIPCSGTDRQAGPSLHLGLPTTPEITTSTHVSD